MFTGNEPDRSRERPKSHQGEGYTSEQMSDDNEPGGVLLPDAEISASDANHPEPGLELDPRKRGMQRARHREMVRQAARRGVAFGFNVHTDDTERTTTDNQEVRKKVLAVQNGETVDPSFAKGEWGVKWLDKHV